MKKIISVLLSLVMLLSALPVAMSVGAAPAKTPAHLGPDTNLALVQSNANLAFYLNQNTADFAILNIKSGEAWYSNPIDIDETLKNDEEAFSKLNTKLEVRYLNSSYKQVTINSGDAAIITERNGEDWIVTFYFKGEDRNFTVSVLFRLEDNYLHTELLIDRIREFGDSRILDVYLFPYFGAANKTDKGYIFYPDGTGSIIEFNQQLQQYLTVGSDPLLSSDGDSTKLFVLGQVYGSNAMEIMNSHYITDWHEEIRLPVYGAVKNNEAYLSVIESGAALATAYADLANNSTYYYNRAYVSVNVRETQGRKNATGTGGSGSYYTEQTPENFISRYYFMTGEDASYIGMAECYRQYLIDEKGMTKVKDDASNALCINLYGAVKKYQHILGIPYTGSEELTSYDEAGELVDRLNESGVKKAYLNYTGWAKGGLETTLTTDLDANSALGSYSDLEDLIAKVSELDQYNISFDIDLQAFYGANSDVKKMEDTATGLDLMPITVYRKRLFASGARDTNKIDKQLIHPGRMLDYATEFMTNAMAENVTSFSFNSIGNSIYSSYNHEDEYTLDKTALAMEAIFKKSVENVGEKGIVSTKGGNSYAVPYVDILLDAPISSSNYIFASQEVPFYQIVFRGYVNLASSAVNLNSEQDDMILKLAETGMSLYYDLMDAESTAFHDTNFTNLFACELDDHYDDMIANYTRLSAVYDAVGNSTIVDYQVLSDHVRVTTFENNVKVYVNYDDSAVEIDGVKIASKDFTVVGGAEV